MNVSAVRKGIVDWAGSVPAHVPGHLVRYFSYWKIFYPLGGIAHLAVLLLFLQTDVRPMVIAGIFSVAAYVAAFILLARGYLRSAFWVAVIELVAHGVVATVCLGTQYGFQYYAILVVVLLFIQPFYGAAVSSLLAGLTMASTGIVTFHALKHPPLYVIDSGWSDTITVTMVVLWPAFVLIMVLPFIRASARAEKDVQAAHRESERLLLNILPQAIAERLKSSQGMIADEQERVAILFVDIVGFTELSERFQPTQIVTLLNGVFNAIDDLVARYGAEKIKTIGDAYMVVAGLPAPIDDPEDKIARLALDIRATVSGFTIPGKQDPVRVRIGINAGKVVAGVIGNRKFAYDLWGDAVNIAARMEATSVIGEIQMTDDFARRLTAGRFDFRSRGEIDIKGKGRIATSFLEGVRG